MTPTHQPIDWSARLETNTGGPATLAAGPDRFGNFTVVGDFGRGTERRYCSANGIDVTSLLRFVRPASAYQVATASPVAGKGRACGTAWPGSTIKPLPAMARVAAGTRLPPKVSRSIPAPA